MLDGADNNDTSVPGGQSGISSTNPDSAQEFRVITNNFDAEFGRNTGAVIDVVTRGGSNQYHGDVYELGRYNALGARDYFNTKSNGKQDPMCATISAPPSAVPFGRSTPSSSSTARCSASGQRVPRPRPSRQPPTSPANFTYVDPVDGSQTLAISTPARPIGRIRQDCAPTPSSQRFSPPSRGTGR